MVEWSAEITTFLMEHDPYLKEQWINNGIDTWVSGRQFFPELKKGKLSFQGDNLQYWLPMIKYELPSKI